MFKGKCERVGGEEIMQSCTGVGRVFQEFEEVAPWSPVACTHIKDMCACLQYSAGVACRVLAGEESSAVFSSWRVVKDGSGGSCREFI